MSTHKQRVSQYFTEKHEALNQYLVDILSRVVAQKTVNFGKEQIKDFPYMNIPGQESRVTAILETEFKAMGIPYKTYEMVKDRANIIGQYGEGSKSLLVASHLDVVPPGEEGWNSDPFTAKVKGGKIYGRGVLDNKGPLASTMLALKALKELNIPLGGKLLVAGIVNEEYHEKGEEDPGVGYLMKNGFLKPDYAIIPDMGMNMKVIDIAEKGRVVIKVTAKGKQAHGSTPEKGINAVVMMSEFLSKLKSIKMSFTAHKYLTSPSVNVGIIKGGSAANIVPATCEATIDLRLVPGQTPEHILSLFKETTHGISDADFDFSVESAALPHEINPDNIIVKTIQKCTQDVFGYTPELQGFGGSTFAKNFALSGINAVGFGPGDDDAFHIVNEYVELKELFDFSHLLCHIAIDLLNT